MAGKSNLGIHGSSKCGADICVYVNTHQLFGVRSSRVLSASAVLLQFFNPCWCHCVSLDDPDPSVPKMLSRFQTILQGPSGNV